MFHYRIEFEEMRLLQEITRDGSNRNNLAIPSMKIWAITFDPSTVKNQTFDDVCSLNVYLVSFGLMFDQLYTKCLDLVDLESKEKIKKYFHRVDAFRTCIPLKYFAQSDASTCPQVLS